MLYHSPRVILSIAGCWLWIGLDLSLSSFELGGNPLHGFVHIVAAVEG
jgi:hypothetical protein